MLRSTIGYDHGVTDDMASSLSRVVQVLCPRMIHKVNARNEL